MKKVLITLLVTMLLLSLSGIAQEEANDVKVSSKIMGYNKTFNREIVIINIAIDNNVGGNMTYVESYYFVNQSGKTRLGTVSKPFNTTINKNPMSIRMLRPLKTDGKPYTLIKSEVTINDKKYVKWFNLNNINSTNTSKPATDKNATMVKVAEDKQNESPGIGALALVGIVYTVYLIRRKIK